MQELYNYSARLERVIDGDTVILRVDLGFKIMVTVTFRLAGIDTPERGHPGFTEAASRLLDLLTDHSPDQKQWLLVKTEKDLRGDDKQGKYGRYLAWIWCADAIVDGPLERSYGGSVNWLLIEEGLAQPYNT